MTSDSKNLAKNTLNRACFEDHTEKFSWKNIIEMNHIDWKIFSLVLNIWYLFRNLGPPLPYNIPDSCENHPYLGLLAEFSPSEVKITWFQRFGTYWSKYRLLISFLWVIWPSDCDLKYHSVPQNARIWSKKVVCIAFSTTRIFELFLFIYTIRL